MFDVLCIDWGSKRVGLAFGSTETLIILPYTKDFDIDDVWSILKYEITQRVIQHIVLGYPVTFTGAKTRITIDVELFHNQLREKYPGIPITIINERNSTKHAKSQIQSHGKINTDKYQINHLAACEILRHYFESIIK
jgi:putative transcription antitermination factor YqgF